MILDKSPSEYLLSEVKEERSTKAPSHRASGGSASLGTELSQDGATCWGRGAFEASWGLRREEGRPPEGFALGESIARSLKEFKVGCFKWGAKALIHHC